jgi:acyl dehydratase
MAEKTVAKLVTGREASYRQITPEMVADAKARIGHEIKHLQPYVEMTSKDAIRHWAEGVGDMNQLWTNEEYAASTKWGGIIAPPSIVMCLDRNMIAASHRGFPGVHGWHLGCSFEWNEPILRDHHFRGRAVMESIEKVESAYAGGSAYDQTIRTELTDLDTQTVACVAQTFIRRFEREKGRDTQKYKRTEKQLWTDEEIEDVADAYRREDIRGATPRYVEDVAPGESLPTIVRGPLTVTDCVAFNLGWGGAFVFAHGFAYEFLRKAPGAFPPNDSNIPDAPERTHWIDAFAQQVGAPAAFDYGPQRIAWCTTFLTNWIGDDGFLKTQRVRILRPNYHGDLVTISGTVTSVDADTGRVDIEYVGSNQLGETVCDGTGTVILPSRKNNDDV